MILNLWNRKSIFDAIQKTYHISNSEMDCILEQLNDKVSYVVTFCKKTGIKLDKEYLPNEFKIVGKIVSTSIDENECLKSRGLLPIDILLSSETPISKYLKEKGIVINTSRKEFILNGNIFNIPSNIEECDWCSLGKKECEYENIKYKNMFCPYLEAVQGLTTKLFLDNSEIEMFLYGSRKTMLEYSQVRYYPEILFTINSFCSDYFNINLELPNGWKKLNPRTYIFTITVNYKDLSFKSDFINDGVDASDLIWELRDCCNEYYEIPEFAPACFWDNVWFIKTCIKVLICENYDNREEICAGIKHNIHIEADNISLEEIT